MKIEFSVDGGVARFPGLAAPVTIDAATLPVAQRDRIASLVDRARFFEAPAPREATEARDARCYTIAIDDGRRRRRVTVSDPIDDSGMRELVDELRTCAAGVRRAGPRNA